MRALHRCLMSVLTTLLLATLAQSLLPMRAAQAQDNLQGEVIVESQDEATVARALGEILAEILMRAADSPEVVQSDAVRAAINKAGDYVQTYTFRQELVSDSGQPTRRLFLTASFDRRTVQSLLRQGGVNALPTNAAQADVAIQINRVAGSADYSKVLGYLGQLPVVRKLQVESADRDRLYLRATVAGAGEALISSVIDSSVLTWIAGDGTGPIEFDLIQ